LLDKVKSPDDFVTHLLPLLYEEGIEIVTVDNDAALQLRLDVNIIKLP
jgi:hypothetical protein